eukprot:9023581-Lingulodinium_polyedra.AAC.1
MPDSIPCHSDQDGACINMMHVSRVQCHEATEKPCSRLEKRPPVLGRKIGRRLEEGCARERHGGRLFKEEACRR